MVRGALKAVIAAFAIIGLVTTGLWALRLSSGTPKPEYITSTLSPSGKYKATLATWAGGGGLSPYCYDQLSVSEASLPQEMAIADNLTVFAGECSTFRPQNGVSENSPILRWDEDSRLRVTLSIDRTALFPATVKLRKQDASGAVAVEFEVRQ